MKIAGMTCSLLRLLGVLTLMALAGCFSGGFIDERITMLDTVPFADLIKIKEQSQQEISPMPQEMLIGTWKARFDVYDRYSQEEIAPIVAEKLNLPLSECITPNSFEDMELTFNADGTYVLSKNTTYPEHSYGAEIFSVHRSGESGRWTYENGTLTLFQEKYTYYAVYGSGNSSDGSSDCKSEVKCKVLWYSSDDISIRRGVKKLDAEMIAKNPEHYKQFRWAIHYDRRGMEIERMIKITGMKDYRETGWVLETVRSPGHYRKVK